MVSKRMENIIKQFRKWQNTPRANTVESLRKALDLMASFPKIAKDIKIEKANIDGIQAEWITTPDIKRSNALLYLHGGAYIGGSIRNSREFCSRISRSAGVSVLNVDYRLAPEYPFPSALEDSINTYKWLLKTGFLPENIIFGGDSAGGGLVIAAMVKLKDSRIKLPAAAFCLSPWVDLALKGETMETKESIDPFVTKEGLEMAVSYYLKNEDILNPLASPLYANLEGLPPLFIQVGTSELLLDDSIRLAQQAQNFGIEVQLKIWKDMIHVFSLLGNTIPEVQAANKEIIEFINLYLR